MICLKAALVTFWKFKLGHLKNKMIYISIVFNSNGQCKDIYRGIGNRKYGKECKRTSPLGSS